MGWKGRMLAIFLRLGPIIGNYLLIKWAILPPEVSHSYKVFLLGLELILFVGPGFIWSPITGKWPE